MSIKTTSLVFAAACLTAIATMPAGHARAAQLVTNGPQADQGDMSSTWSARQNVIESHRYDRMVETSPGFRAYRMRKECGPIADPQLRQSCLASFNRYEPPAVGYGSSSPNRRYRNGYGR
jgi:hypothetical protein